MSGAALGLLGALPAPGFGMLVELGACVAPGGPSALFRLLKASAAAPLLEAAQIVELTFRP